MIHLHLCPKPRTFKGRVYTYEPDGTYHANIHPGESIRLYGVRYEGTQFETRFDRTFRVGDFAEYDSYNLCYFGKITQITDKAVTIADSFGQSAHRLDLYTFAWRNYDFDAGKAAERNADEMQYI